MHNGRLAATTTGAYVDTHHQVLLQTLALVQNQHDLSRPERNTEQTLRVTLRQLKQRVDFSH